MIYKFENVYLRFADEIGPTLEQSPRAKRRRVQAVQPMIQDVSERPGR